MPYLLLRFIMNGEHLIHSQVMILWQKIMGQDQELANKRHHLKTQNQGMRELSFNTKGKVTSQIKGQNNNGH